MRRSFFGPALTMDAIPGGGEQAREPTGLSIEEERPPRYQSQRVLMTLPHSVASLYLAQGTKPGTADLWLVGETRGDPGIDPLDADAARERLRAGDTRPLDPNTWGEGEESERRQKIEAGLAQRQVEDASRKLTQATRDGRPWQAAGIALGRAARQRDSGRLRALNLRNRAWYGAA